MSIKERTTSERMLVSCELVQGFCGMGGKGTLELAGYVP